MKSELGHRQLNCSQMMVPNSDSQGQNQHAEADEETPQLACTDRSDLEVRILVTSIAFDGLIYPGCAASYISSQMEEQNGGL